MPPLYMYAKYIRHRHTLGGDMLFTSDPCYGNSLLANVFWSEYCILLVLCIAALLQVAQWQSESVALEVRRHKHETLGGALT